MCSTVKGSADFDHGNIVIIRSRIEVWVVDDLSDGSSLLVGVKRGRRGLASHPVSTTAHFLSIWGTEIVTEVNLC